MEDPVVAALKPCLVNLQKGRRYMWCTCGKSKKQPFCDGAHKGTSFMPIIFTAEEDGEALLCACKHTQRGPFCDGSHNSLSESYGDEMGDISSEACLVDFDAMECGAAYARLDNNCFVVRPNEASSLVAGGFQLYQTIAPEDGADQLSQFSGRVVGSETPVISFGESDAVIFIMSGEGSIAIGQNHFPLALHNGAYVKGGEAFKLSTAEGAVLEFNITVCPLGPQPRILDAMPDTFDKCLSNRVEIIDPNKRAGMADRFYQVLVDGEKYGTEVTQFVGHIPMSRAAHHKHIYEETLTILSGEGYMWTDDTKSKIKAGDTIFLPLKQSHSVEATNPEGIMLVGVFFPSMSPAINY